MSFLSAVILAVTALTADQVGQPPVTPQPPPPQPAGTPSVAAQSAATVTLQSALASAEEHNRTLVAARLGRAVDLAGIDVARQRPNPEASYEAARDTPHQVAQPGPATRAWRQAVAARRCGQRDARAHNRRARGPGAWISGARCRVAYFDLVAAANRVQITSELRSFAERTRNAARDRFESGAAPRLEALQAELALAQADNEQEAAQGRLGAARATLNTLIGRPPDAPAEPADTFGAGAVPADLAAAIAAHPDVVAIDRAIDEAVARERLAVAMRKPDPTVSGGVLIDSQPDFMYGWRFGVAITIPVFTTHKADVQVETARVAQLRAEREAKVADADRRRGRRRRARTGGSPGIPPLPRRDHPAAGRHRIHGGGLLPLRSDRYRGISAGAPGCAASPADSPPMWGSSIRERWRISSARSEDRFDETRVDSGRLLGAMLLPGCHKAAPDETETETAVAVEVEPAKTGAVREVFAATGLVTAAPGADLIVAAPDSARIAEMPKAEGDRVRAGDLLVRFDIPTLTAGAASARAGIEQAMARLENAKAAADRLEGLFQRGVAARKEVEDAQRELREANAALLQAQSAVGCGTGACRAARRFARRSMG